MKVRDAIAEVDALKPNMFTEEDKVRWLSRLEARIYGEIICTHERNAGEEEISFPELSPESGDKELIVGLPYDELYLRWLEAQIDFHNREYEAFNNVNAVFEAVYGAFRNAYNQSHMPKGARKLFY